MIINIRGTGGSGKSTIVRTVMSQFDFTLADRVDCGTFQCQLGPQYVDGRRQPIGYIKGRLDANGRPQRLYVIGHYETPCGGGDTIKTPAEVFETAREMAGKGFHVLFEGIISQDDVTRTVALSKDFPLKIVALTTPIADCLAGIQARRDARGDTRPLDPSNTENRFKSVRTRVAKLRAAGVDVVELNREEALRFVLTSLTGDL